MKVVAGDFAALPANPADGVRIIRQLQRRLSELEAAQIAEQYRDGKSTYQLATEWKINRSTVTMAVKRARVPIRMPRLSDSQIEEAARLYASGWSFIRLGKKFEMDPKTIKRRIAPPTSNA